MAITGVPNTYGFAPANATTENTFAIGQDALILPPATTLAASYNFYDATTSKPVQYRTSILQTLAQQKAIAITSMVAIHNFAFAAMETEAVNSQVQNFNLFSYIRLTILQKTQDLIPVSCLVSQEIWSMQTVVTSSLKFAQIFRFPEPIQIPQGGDIVIQLLPAPGYSLAAAGATNPHYPGAGLASDRGFSFTLQYFGGQGRPIA